MPIIDAHLHLAPASPVFNEWARKTGVDHSFEGLMRDMDRNNVERAIMIGHWVIDEGVRDWPLMAIRPYIEFVESCDFLTDEERKTIMYDNADRLYWKQKN